MINSKSDLSGTGKVIAAAKVFKVEGGCICCQQEGQCAECSAWDGCHGSVARSYIAFCLSNVSELLLVRDVAPLAFKHVVAGVAMPAELDGRENYSSARVRLA